MIVKFWSTSLLMMTLFLNGNWKVEPSHAKISFSVKGPFGTVHGSFSGLKATIDFDPKNFKSSKMEASIDTKTISTGISLRNHDLRTQAQWFDADKYPEIRFHSARIERAGNSYAAIGELTIKGVTKPLTIQFTFSDKGNTGVFKGHFELNREEFKLGKHGGSVGEVVSINIEVPVSR